MTPAFVVSDAIPQERTSEGKRGSNGWMGMIQDYSFPEDIPPRTENCAACGFDTRVIERFSFEER
jgi:hypothetical protein